jgi:hypothetical protein
MGRCEYESFPVISACGTNRQLAHILYFALVGLLETVKNP